MSVHVNAVNQLTRGYGAVIIPTSTADIRSLRGLVSGAVRRFKNGFSFVLRSVNVSPGIHGNHACSSLSCSCLSGALSVSTVSFRGTVRITHHGSTVGS